ncbi:hypothetical protein [Pseudonocardia hydrocarbonoxydans]|jgi:hypothetical protein|uniref:Secreted protein n=1 Tax=Pseudonocardia hydrocarbonoxydans TaxID=76726 RepID=A0A4Y3WT65_9PSEU|nr:hypothetical protein [Pseudonocardia hydrocarbonoxydans]GEC21964.1 hypothetical protein PHY01_42470 [Pseudonocardia hydrocarbonoxydans]
MTTVVRLGGYATVLAVAFGVAFGVGSAVGEPPATVPGTGHTAAGHATDGRPAATDGLAATSAGYTLVPATDTLTPGEPGGYAFTVTGPDGAPVTAFDVAHDRPLHLVVVRRDAAGFQHLHPELGPGGVWRVPLTLPAGGVYRVYADFTPVGGPPLVLGTDLFAPGDFTPLPSTPSRVAGVDRYQVRLDGDLVPGTESAVFATVSLDGAPVTDLEPHLGAFGHLVAIRRSDLAYVHVHPDAPAPAATDRSGPGVPFVAEVPSAGGYRLFLDFRHGGVVRTAEFTVDVG